MRYKALHMTTINDYPVSMDYQKLWFLLDIGQYRCSVLLAEFCSTYTQSAPLHVAAFLGNTRRLKSQAQEMLLLSLDEIIELFISSDSSRQQLMTAILNCIGNISYEMFYSVIPRLQRLVQNPIGLTMDLTLKEQSLIFTRNSIIVWYHGRDCNIEKCRFTFTIVLLLYRFFYLPKGEVVLMNSGRCLVMANATIAEVWTCLDEKITDWASDFI
ncbi:hypothetical protein RCL1_006325 [Eukaryota sp. TZLM3-RCL]